MNPFRYLLRVRYLECDPQGIAFNSRYADWTDLAMTELLRALDPAHLTTDPVDYRLRKQETEWLAPARFDEVVEARPEVVAVGDTSVTTLTHFTRAQTEEPLARVCTVYVLVDGQGRKKGVPERLRARLLAGAAGRVVDHAAAGGGRVRRVVRGADRVSSPWKNGGGLTHELWREGGGPAGFALRLSIAEVASDGPFSHFPGVDRVICLLDGAGFRLRRADGLALTLSRPAPFAFHGEDDWTCTLLGGPALDFNLMVDRAQLRAAMSLVGPGPLAGRFWLALAPGRVGGVEIDRFELAELEGTVLADGPGLLVSAFAP